MKELLESATAELRTNCIPFPTNLVFYMYPFPELIPLGPRPPRISSTATPLAQMTTWEDIQATRQIIETRSLVRVPEFVVLHIREILESVGVQILCHAGFSGPVSSYHDKSKKQQDTDEHRVDTQMDVKTVDVSWCPLCSEELRRDGTSSRCGGDWVVSELPLEIRHRTHRRRRRRWIVLIDPRHSLKARTTLMGLSLGNIA